MNPALSPAAAEAIQLRQANPCATLQEIGDQVGLTRQRVAQVLTRAELSTRNARPLKPKPTYICQDCGAAYQYRHRPKRYQRSQEEAAVFCPACREKNTAIPVVCDGCGRLWLEDKSQLLARLRRAPGIYCSRSCSAISRDTGHKYGFGAHPENIRLGLDALRRRRMGHEPRAPQAAAQ